MEATTTSNDQSAPIRRPRLGRALAGVAAALAQRTGIGVGWVRAAFVVTAFLGGAGVLAYVIGWLTIPEEGERLSIAGQMLEPLESRGTGRMVGTVLLTIAALTALSTADVLSARWILIGGLAVFGILLYRGEVLATPPPVSTGAADPLAVDGGSTAADATATAATEPAHAVARPRSPLGRLTIAALFVATGVLAVLAVSEAVTVRPVHFAATALAVIGTGLIVSAFIGRARWLAIVGILLIPIVLVLSAVPTAWSSQVGERRFVPIVADEYRIGAGSLRLDLTQLETGSAPVVAEVGAGELWIVLPADRGAVLDAEVGVGELRIADVVQRNGIGLDEERTIPGPDPVHVDAATGFGSLLISWEDR